MLSANAANAHFIFTCASAKPFDKNAINIPAPRSKRPKTQGERQETIVAIAKNKKAPLIAELFYGPTHGLKFY
jgi:hypothetical protein